MLKNEIRKIITNVKISGQIFVANMLDHETATEVSFEVVAEDGGADSKSSIAVVVIKISDVNDCPPVIIPTYSIIHMKENYTPSSPFLMVSFVFLFEIIFSNELIKLAILSLCYTV